MTPELSALCATQGGPFTMAQALACGVTRGWVRHAVKDGRVLVLRRGVFVESTLVLGADARGLHRLDVAAALLNRELPPDPTRRHAPEQRLAVGHRSAAVLWKLCAPLPPVLGDPPQPEHARPARIDDATPPVRHLVELISADRCRRSFRWGVHVRPATLPVADVTVLDCLPVTTIERTVVDLARELSRRDAVMVADSALRRGASADRMREIADECRVWRGGRQALEVVAFADGRAESAAESLARYVLAKHGLPAPELQVELSDAAGLIGRVDMLFRDLRTIVEIDGKVKYTGQDSDVLWREKRREDRLREAGWEVVRVTWTQLVSAPREVVARIRAAFARAQRATG